MPIMEDWLREEQIEPGLIARVAEFSREQPVPPELAERVPVPAHLYYGREIWQAALTALLCGQNLLLAGPKSCGKNVLAENLAAAFGRPRWDISFHVGMDASGLIGADTFRSNEVSFRPGPVWLCAKNGGFGILDEINMARNEALAVLHAALDFRRVLDVPGYERIPLHGATRFIATMNYGYAGTRELNEALASRFAVLQMPVITDENLHKLIRREIPDLREEYVGLFAALFEDLEKKCESAEISDRSLDLRGLLAALQFMENGLDPMAALDMGLVNKSFDSFERSLVKDLIRSRIPKDASAEKMFRSHG